ncbi:MAG: Phosphate transport system substrate-binding protein, partial [Lacunisphaera sp.]|nr:Phosphate transport system substrate-binding protein [Lacunisphaera sp.]
MKPRFKNLVLAFTLTFAACAQATEWDLKLLPHYKPQQQVGGILRLGGVGMSGLVPLWEEAFARYHPEIRFANNLPSSDVAMAAMIMGTADIAACGREPDLVEILGFTESYLYDVLPIIVGSGAHTTPKGQGGSWSPVIFVSKDNPLTKLTMKQVDGIFGSQRAGGYRENSALFDPRSARGPEGDIRTWGQLGLTGEWANKPIQTYGYADTGMRHFFELKVFNGGDKWNPNYREYTETGTKMVPDGSGMGSRDMLITLSKDKYGIGWSGFGQANNIPGANLKAIALAKEDGGPYYEPTEVNFQTKDYPLSRNVFMYINRPPGMPV